MCLTARPGEEIWEFFNRVLPLIRAHSRPYWVEYKGTRFEIKPEDTNDEAYAKWRALRK